MFQNRNVRRRCENVQTSSSGKKDEDFRRVLGRFDDTQPVDTYRMTRCTYGIISSSYHSIPSLTNCSKCDNVPLPVQQAFRRDLCVDHILTGANSVSEAKALPTGLIATLKQSQFDLRKWTSNTPAINLDLPEEFRQAIDNFEFLATDHTVET